MGSPIATPRSVDARSAKQAGLWLGGADPDSSIVPVLETVGAEMPLPLLKLRPGRQESGPIAEGTPEASRSTGQASRPNSENEKRNDQSTLDNDAVKVGFPGQTAQQ